MSLTILLIYIPQTLGFPSGLVETLVKKIRPLKSKAYFTLLKWFKVFGVEYFKRVILNLWKHMETSVDYQHIGSQCKAIVIQTYKLFRYWNCPKFWRGPNLHSSMRAGWYILLPLQYFSLHETQFCAVTWSLPSNTLGLAHTDADIFRPVHIELGEGSEQVTVSVTFPAEAWVVSFSGWGDPIWWRYSTDCLWSSGS